MTVVWRVALVILVVECMVGSRLYYALLVSSRVVDDVVGFGAFEKGGGGSEVAVLQAVSGASAASSSVAVL